jgi:hypothetical protein
MQRGEALCLRQASVAPGADLDVRRLTDHWRKLRRRRWLAKLADWATERPNLRRD